MKMWGFVNFFFLGLVLHPHNCVQAKLVVPDPVVLSYHNGRVVSGIYGEIPLNVIYYGDFSSKQIDILRSFFNAIYTPSRRPYPKNYPTVGKWWQILHQYVDRYGDRVANNVKYSETYVGYPLGKSLTKIDIRKLVVSSFGTFGTDAKNIYLVLTAADVFVENFCNNVCGTHFHTSPSNETSSQMIPYAWVGNSGTQCPALCTYPFTDPATKEPSHAYPPPNGDLAIDGMVITIANILAGTATNPYANGFFQGDASAPVEVAGACTGTFGEGAYSGYPGDHLVDNVTRGIFNVHADQDFQFLLPWIMHPGTRVCAGQV